MQRTRSEVAELAPKLLAAFDAAQDDDDEEGKAKMEDDSHEDVKMQDGSKIAATRTITLEDESDDELSMQSDRGRRDLEDQAILVISSGESSETSSREATSVPEDYGLDRERPQDMHYHICANPNCGKAPAAELLEAHDLKANGRGKKQGGRKKKRHEDELDTDEEREMDSQLGAWIECATCISAYHFTFEKSAIRPVKAEGDGDMQISTAQAPNGYELGCMFRCQLCRRAAHYGCVEVPEFEDAGTTWVDHVITYYRSGLCHDCERYDNEWQVELDVILGWKESDESNTSHRCGEKVRDPKSGLEFVLPTAKDPTCPALYLVKWKGLSYRDVAWVQHSWLSARYNLKLSNFLSKGSNVTFEPSKEELGDEAEVDSADALDKANEQDYFVGPAPDAQIESKIPQAWKTVDRIISVWYISPATGRPITFDGFRSRPADDKESVKLISRCYIKWQGLPYSQSTEQDPLREGDEGYETFFNAYKSYVVASQREMRVPRLNPTQMAQLDAKRPGKSPVFTKQPDTVKNGQLMDFQIQGLSFLLNHWWVKTGCILADEMGLGKTCQLICFLGYLNLVQKARPFLIVVPNSLVSNWLREFERWAPELRTVAYNGDAESRRIVENFEMFADNGDLKTHVVITTYEALKNHANVLARCTRWDCLVIDEGQALKSGETNKLWAGLGKLRVGMKILLTGTPLNNNLRELYNLLNFLAPEEFANVAALSDPTLEMTKERVDRIREDLRPYMLRRTKDQVLNLPPLGEFVVPVHLTLLQRQLYRGILEKNSAAILSIVNNAGKNKTKAKTTATTNTLMTLRKIVCHPYLHVPELDPGNTVPAQEAFRQLTDASAKLVLLEKMLPRLREKGHKVLIFSQFKIVLNKLGAFLDGIGTKWLRLDGDTPQLDRQRDVDRFNDPASPYSVFILSTRAGGVGLTLTSADVVILFDQDFNPFQDMQAIARAHRIGQKNPVRVFRLVVKGTCEEKILASGRKKQGLEHLIIQKIDARDDETEDVAGALQYGAQAILETDDAEAEKAAQRYTDAEIDELLSKTAEPLNEAAQENAGAFATAQVWVSEKGGLGDVDAIGQVEAAEDLGGFWDRIVAKEAQKEQEKTMADEDAAFAAGRSRRAKKAVNYKVPLAINPIDPGKRRSKRTSDAATTDAVSSGDDYRLGVAEGHSDHEGSDFSIDEPVHGLSKGERISGAETSSILQAPDSEEEKVALARLRQKKLEKRKKVIVQLLNESKKLNDEQVSKLLREALEMSDAEKQKDVIDQASRRIKYLNDLQERKDTADRADSSSLSDPSSPSSGTASMPATEKHQHSEVTHPAAASHPGKRKSDSPVESRKKRPRASPPSPGPPSSVTTIDKPPTSAGPTKTVSGPKGVSPMIRSDSQGSKKPVFSQQTLSFASKPASAGKRSPLAAAANLPPDMKANTDAASKTLKRSISSDGKKPAQPVASTSSSQHTITAPSKSAVKTAAARDTSTKTQSKSQSSRPDAKAKQLDTIVLSDSGEE
ncbi:uncharacterized protein JCM15063_005733 [Sporobolomyces koalae]|uniref:uncharacterized protein n=1 Tax=Sporobolomyces koalae TaxID=500713 RepID=UPI0031824CBD